MKSLLSKSITVRSIGPCIGLAITLIFGFGSANATTLAESTFDPGMDFDGWTGVECGNPGLCPLIISGELGPLPASEFFHDTTDPQPFEAGAGYLEIVDPSSGTTGLYDAPSEFTSVLAPGTALEFDLKINGGSYDNGGSGLVPLFYVESLGTGTGALYAVPEAAAPIGPWLEFNIPIVPNGDPLAGPGFWFGFTPTALDFGSPDDGTAFGVAFGGDIILRIFGELTKDAPDADGTQLDNVRITVVPVPAALPMMLSALAAFGVWRRRSV